MQGLAPRSRSCCPDAGVNNTTELNLLALPDPSPRPARGRPVKHPVPEPQLGDTPLQPDPSDPAGPGDDTRPSRPVRISELERYVESGRTSGELRRQHAVSVQTSRERALPNLYLNNENTHFNYIKNKQELTIFIMISFARHFCVLTYDI